MIDFACKKFSIDEIIKCSLGLTRSDFTVMKLLLARSETSFNTESISKKLNLDISTVQRSVKKLSDLGILSRMQNNFQAGGYEFTYIAKDRRLIIKIILDIVDRWVKKVGGELEHWQAQPS